MKINKLHLLVIGLIILIVIAGYYQLPRSFFEQDEWHSFGYYNYLLSLNGLDFLGNALKSGPFAHFTPFSLFFKMGLYKLFGLNAAPYFLVSIFLHILVSLAVYMLILLFLKKQLPALFSAIFFAINSSHYQAVTWIGTFEGTELSTLFGIVALIFGFLYLEKNTKKYF